MAQDKRWGKLLIYRGIHFPVLPQVVSIEVEAVLDQSLDIFRFCLAWIVSEPRKVGIRSVQQFFSDSVGIETPATVPASSRDVERSNGLVEFFILLNDI